MSFWGTKREHLPLLLVQGFGVPEECKIEFQGLAVEWIRRRGTDAERKALEKWEQGLLQELAPAPAFPDDEDDIAGNATG